MLGEPEEAATGPWDREAVPCPCIPPEEPGYPCGCTLCPQHVLEPGNQEASLPLIFAF